MNAPDPLLRRVLAARKRSEVRSERQGCEGTHRHPIEKMEKCRFEMIRREMDGQQLEIPGARG